MASGAATLTIEYDKTLFRYDGYVPGEAVTTVNISDDVNEGRLSISISPADAHGIEALGYIRFQAPAEAALINGNSAINAVISYVIMVDEVEYIESLQATVEIGTRGMKGDTNNDQVIDLIDLSNMNSWFGDTPADESWQVAYYYDYNGNNVIDIGDITEVVVLM